MAYSKLNNFLIPFLLGLPFIGFAKNDGQQNIDTSGYEITITLKPYKNQSVYLGHYWGKESLIIDTALLDNNSNGVFKGDATLEGGMYFIIYPDGEGSMNLLVDKKQYFTVNADLTNPDEFIVSFKNSPENDLLNKYETFVYSHIPALQVLNEDLSNASNEKDAEIIKVKIDSIDKSIVEFREEMAKQNPSTLLSTLFIAIREPVLPPTLKNGKSPEDSAAQKKYIEAHYWDGVNFWDGRLAFTPFFDEKLDQFLDKIIDQRADSVIRFLDHMLAFASSNEIMSKFLLTKLIYGTINHVYKWENAVFIHLFEKYISIRTYSWLSDEEKNEISERAYFLMSKVKGNPATDISLPDTKGNKVSLFTIPAKYTLVSFWDPTCEHCRETLPRLDSIYQAKWKANGLKIFSVGVESEGTKTDWLNFINMHHLNEWANVYNSPSEEQEMAAAGKTLVLNEYDVWYYPSFFLLDEEKKFMAKKLSYEQVFELVESVLKNQ